MKELLHQYTLGNMTAVYRTDEQKHVELLLYPTAVEKRVVWSKTGKIDSLVQVMFDGDATAGGFSAGHTLRNSETTEAFHYKSCMEEKTENGIKIITCMENAMGQQLYHSLSCRNNENFVRIKSKIVNNGKEGITLNMLSSFSLGGLTPFCENEAGNQMKYYQIRSAWSAEGKVVSGMIEDLQLEPSWSRHGVSVEKFGQLGSMPVRKFHPFVAVEDVENKTVWAVALACGGSWQMELYRRDENLCISGGLADFDFGHWSKCIKPGESFESPEAVVTAVRGTLEEACENLVEAQERTEYFTGLGKKLPVVFNEFCTTWGNPSEQNIEQIAQKLKNKDFDYFVIDAGWYADENGGWENNMGDWNISAKLFPSGLEKTVETIKAAGMKPGIWFELEVVGKDARALTQQTHLLTKHGKVIQSGERFFWNMRDSWVKEYLSEKVIDFLSKYGFEYVKIDYNESIGIGCDCADSLGQGLYENIAAVQDFYRAIHKAIPGIVIELCSSGGHRLEPSFLDITDMASFSDAHEQLEIPVIAANVHRVMRPEKSQIWSVIRKEDSLKRICYSMSAAFLGVLCVSGDVTELSDAQWSMVQEGISFYRRLDGIIKDGVTSYYGTVQKSYRQLEGIQGILRKGTAVGEAYLVLHSFEPEQSIQIPIDEGFEPALIYEAGKHRYQMKAGYFQVTFQEAMDAMAVLFVKK